MALVKLARPITIVDGTTEVSMYTRDFLYPDDDGDGYGNLIELEASTNPRNPDDKPQTANVFVTSSQGVGDLSLWEEAEGKSGQEAGDAICDSLATRAQLDGKYWAWLSSAETDAFCHVLGTAGLKDENCGLEPAPDDLGPWLRIDGVPFSEKLSSLLDDMVLSPVNIDESGNKVPAKEQIWTGTFSNGKGRYGSGEVAPNCNNWTETESTITGRTGETSGTIEWWTSIRSAKCDKNGHLICFQVDQTGPLPDAGEKGKIVFVTSTSGQGKLSKWVPRSGLEGIDAADEVCRESAAKVDLSNAEKYKAWISGSQGHAVNRIKSEGPWTRLDGVLFAKDKEQLLSKNLTTSLSVTENGDYRRYKVWTGTESSDGTLVSNANCQNWTSDSDQDIGEFGESYQVDGNWSTVGRRSAASCSNEKYHLYCFEDE